MQIISRFQNLPPAKTDPTVFNLIFWFSSSLVGKRLKNDFKSLSLNIIWVIFVIISSKVMDYWNSSDFQLVAHATRDVAIIVSSDEIVTALEDSQVTLGNIKGSRFSLPIKVCQKMHFEIEIRNG